MRQGAVATKDFWHDGVNVFDANGAQFISDDINGEQSVYPVVTGSGLTLDGDNTGNVNWVGGNLGGFQNCFMASGGGPVSNGAHGHTEGLSIISANFGLCDNGVEYVYDGVPGQVAQFYVAYSQLGGIGRSAFRVAHVGEMMLDKNLIYTRTVFKAVYNAVVTVGSNRVSYQAGNTSRVDFTTVVGPLPQDVEVKVGGVDAFPPGTQITAVTPTALILSHKATIGSTAFDTIQTNGNISIKPTPVITGASFVRGSRDVVLPNAASISPDMHAGGPIDGNSAIPSGAVILDVDAATNTLHMSAKATSTQRGSFTVHYPAPNCMVEADDDINTSLVGNSFEMGGGHNVACVGRFSNQVGTVIKDNHVRDTGNITSAGWIDAGGNVNLVERDTLWNAWRPGVPHVSGAPFASGTGARWSTLYADNGCDLGSSGKVICRGQVTAALDGNAHNVSPIRLPPVFLTNPMIVTTNQDFTRTTAACGTAGGTATPTAAAPSVAFNYWCQPSAANATVTVDWEAWGN